MCQHKAPHREWEPAPRYLGKYGDRNYPEPATLFDDYSGRGLPARDQQMTIANHLNDLDLKLVPMQDQTPEQRAIFTKAYEAENKKLEESKDRRPRANEVELSAVREGLSSLCRCGR